MLIRGERGVQLARAGVGAFAAALEQPAGLVPDVRQARRRGRRQVGGPVEPVGVGVERPGEVAQVPGRDTDGVEHADGPAHRLVGHQLRQKRIPPFFERHIGRNLVERLERRRQSRLHGMFGQDATRKSVQRGDRSAVEFGQRAEHKVALGTRCVLQSLVQLRTDAIAQLCCGLVGEGDGSDRRHRHWLDAAFAGHHRHDPLHQHGGLAGAGTCFDEQQPVELSADQVALCLVRQHHSSSPMGPSTRWANPASPLSVRLRRHCRKMSAVPMPSGLQYGQGVKPARSSSWLT